MPSYSEAIRKHFLDPRNVGALEDADGVGRAQNAACGDDLHLFLRLDAERRIRMVRFQARACSAVIAVGSMTTEALSGLSIEEALKFDVAAMVAEVGGLPSHKAHAPAVVTRALRAALDAAKGSSRSTR